MNGFNLRLLVISCMVAGVGQFAAGQVLDTAAQSATDATITGRIEGMYLLSEHLNPLNINTTTRNGVVTISGSVNDEIQKDLAEQLAMSVNGVTKVENKLIVADSTGDSGPRRTWRQRTEDLSITAAIRTRLVYHKEFKGLHIGVKTERGVTTLHGVVNSEEQKARIGEIAFDTKGVVRVENNLSVEPPTAHSDPVVLAGQQISDEWIEKRVETSILFNRHVSIRALDIEMSDGLCVLTGTVDTETQRTLAGSIAENVMGVREVRNDIQARAPGAPPPPTVPAPVEAEPLEPQPPVPGQAPAPPATKPSIEPYLPDEPREEELLKDP